jgi:acyl-CoA thioesterase
MLAADHALEGLGIQVLNASEGHATAVLTVMPQIANGHGTAHGGIVFPLADTAFAMAADTSCAGIATAEASISCISPARIARGSGRPR